MQYTLVEPPWGNDSYGRPRKVYVAKEQGSTEIVAVLHLIREASDSTPDMVFTLHNTTLDHVGKKQMHTDLTEAETRAEGKAAEMRKADGKAAEASNAEEKAVEVTKNKQQERTTGTNRKNNQQNKQNKSGSFSCRS